MAVRAKAVGEVGPSADMDVITPAEGEVKTRVLKHLDFDEYQGCKSHYFLFNQMIVLYIK